MTRAFVLIAVFATLLLQGADRAAAADLSYRPAQARPLQERPLQALPFPRSERAQSVWASNACWTECGSYTAWGEAGCLQRDGQGPSQGPSQGSCLKLADRADRYCQRECRTSGGPLLPIDF